jgi:23S rRNA (uracil1939-C5)-methyltransferase
MPPKPGDTLELAIDTLAYGGQGIGRVDGFVVFVRGALPGDLALVEVTRRKSGFAEARLISLVAPSPRRTPFRCDHAPDAGGCEWQTFDYSGQLEFKHRQVVEALAHIGGLDHVTVEPIVGMADPWRYRNKMEYSFGLDGGEPVLGMHRRGSWREVVDVPDCHLAPSS